MSSHLLHPCVHHVSTPETSAGVMFVLPQWHTEQYKLPLPVHPLLSGLTRISPESPPCLCLAMSLLTS